MLFRFMSVIAMVILIACIPKLYSSMELSAEASSYQDKQELRYPHGRLFYLHAKNVNIDTEQQILRARELLLQGQDYPMAVAILNQVIAVDRQNSEAYLLRGICHTEMEQPDEAEEDYLSALRLEPENPTFYLYRGRNFLLWQDYAEKKGSDYGWDGQKPNRLAQAERMYEKALEIEPYYIDGMVGLGDVYARMGKWGRKKFAKNLPRAMKFYQEAIDQYNRVLVLFPEHGPVVAKKEDASAALSAIEQEWGKLQRQREIEERIR